MNWFDKKVREKERLLSVVAYSANRSAVDKISQVFKREGIECFYLYENFFFRPLHVKEADDEKILKNMSSTVPFIRRYIEPESERFIPDIEKIKKWKKEQIKFSDLLEDPPVIPKDIEKLRKFLEEDIQRVNLCDESAYSPKLISFWKDILDAVTKDEEKEKIKKAYEKRLAYSHPFYIESFPIVGYEGEFPKKYLKDRYLKEIWSSKNRIPLLIEYLVCDWNFVMANLDKVNHICVSISTDKLFYGYIWIFWASGISNERIKKNIKEKIKHKMVEVIKDHYLPTLTVFENAWEEKFLKELIKEERVIEWENSEKINIEKNHALELVFLKDSNFSDELERIFHLLWKKRWKKWNTMKALINGRDQWKEINKTLIFHKFFVVSQSMVEKLKMISKLNPKKRGDFLPSVLVVGGPGSGKDTVSRLIQIFSDDYFDCEPYVINVASLKPPAVAPSITMGNEVTLKSDSQYKIYELIGLFEKIYQTELERDKFLIKEKDGEKYVFERKKEGKKFQCKVTKISSGKSLLKKEAEEIEKLEDEVVREIENKPDKKFFKQSIRELFEAKAVIILDELNSLDVDTQGALLRFLENSELMKIGSIRQSVDKQKVNFLIIGAMNEDPEKLTKESVFMSLSSQRFFGALVREILYEHFRKLRRLREDLYYRFIRGGKIVIPPLNERREDIPVLFYVFCNIEMEKEKKEVIITFDAFDEILAPHIKWLGNVRQLQTLAKIVVRTAYNDPENIKSESVLVKKEHVRAGLKEIGVEYED